MTRFQRILTAANWRYAVGETLLIVIGILVALAINSWYQDRQNRLTERRILAELGSSLALDLQSFERTQAALRQHDHGLAMVLAHLRGGGTAADSLDDYLGLAYWNVSPPILHTAAYEALKSRGLDLISADSLRLAIVQLYDQAYVRVERSGESGRSSALDVMRPYFLQHFRDLRPGVSAAAIDPGALARDQYFENIVAYRQFVVRENLTPTFDAAREEASRLARRIQHYLGADARQ